VKKQKREAASTCEAEYMVAFNAAKENTWMHSLFEEINFPITKLTTIHCNNNAAIYLSENPLLHE
jgi:hypothetical protein